MGPQCCMKYCISVWSVWWFVVSFHLDLMFGPYQTFMAGRNHVLKVLKLMPSPPPHPHLYQQQRYMYFQHSTALGLGNMTVGLHPMQLWKCFHQRIYASVSTAGSSFSNDLVMAASQGPLIWADRRRVTWSHPDKEELLVYDDQLCVHYLVLFLFERKQILQEKSRLVFLFPFFLKIIPQIGNDFPLVFCYLNWCLIWWKWNKTNNEVQYNKIWLFWTISYYYKILVAGRTSRQKTLNWEAY